MRHLSSLIQLARPEHWIKNLFVLAVLVFARKVGDAGAWVSSLGALAAFCLASSAVYAINDVTDRREDAEHTETRDRRE